MAELMKKQKEVEEAQQREVRAREAANARNMQQRGKADPASVPNGRGPNRGPMEMSRAPQGRGPNAGYSAQEMQHRPPNAMRMSGPPGRSRPPVRPYQTGPPQQRHYAPPMRQKPPPFDFFTILQDGECFGKVRKVMSGDYLFIEILRKNKVKGEEREFKRVTLSEIIAPRIAKNENQIDVLFAWESREFLRRLLIHTIVILKKQDPPEHSNSKNPPRGRAMGEFGTVLFRPNIEDEEITSDRSVWTDVAEILVRRGMVEVKAGASGPRAEALRQIQADAKASQIGKWEPKPENVSKDDRSWSQRHHREVEWSPESETIFKEYHGKPVKAIIEDVREGSCVRCEILVSDRPIKTKIIWLELSGVECPRTPKPISVQKREHKGKGPFVPQKAPPFAEEARMETMIRLLHRDVDVLIEAIDTQKNLYGTVTFHRGDKKRDISNYLLMNGLARVCPWTAKIGGKLESFRSMEQTARAKPKNIWTLEENQGPSEVGKIRTGVVVEVTSGDSFFVKEDGSDPADPPKRLFLASVQAPRNMRNRRRGQPFYYEAKEFVRKALIQQPITYELEYARTTKFKGGKADENFEYVTVTYGNGKNLNQQLVSIGYARVVPHRKRESRSKDYVSLLDAEKDAKLHDLGIHSPESDHQLMDDFTVLPQRPRKKKGKDAPDSDQSKRMEEYNREFQLFRKRASGWAAKHALCESEAAANERRDKDREARNKARGDGGKDFKPSPVPRPKRVSAVVENVHNADRIKVQLPEPRAILNLILSGIDVKGNGDKKLADEACAEVKRMLTQREVQVEIEKVDRNANFIGNVYAPEGMDVSIWLLQNGYAKIFQRQNQRGPMNVRPALRKAENEAKENRAGCWENYTSPAEKVETEEAKESGDRPSEGTRRRRGCPQGAKGDRSKRRERKPERLKSMSVQVTHLSDGVTFFARSSNDPRAEMIEDYMRKIDPTTCTFNPSFKVERGVIVAGLYELDGNFYRCKIQGPGPMDGDVRLWRCDWIDFGERGEVRETAILEIENDVVRNGPPLAMKCVLAGLKPPPENSNYYDSATRRFWSEIFDKSLDLKILRQNKDIRYVTVNFKGDSINDKMLREGVLRVHEGRDMREEPAYKEHLVALQNKAYEDHVGLWQFGDLGSDDEDDDRPKRRGR